MLLNFLTVLKSTVSNSSLIPSFWMITQVLSTQRYTSELGGLGNVFARKQGGNPQKRASRPSEVACNIEALTLTSLPKLPTPIY